MKTYSKELTNITAQNQNMPVDSDGKTDMGLMHEYSRKSTTAHKDDFSFLRIPRHETVRDIECVNDNLEEQNESRANTDKILLRPSRIS